MGNIKNSEKNSFQDQFNRFLKIINDGAANRRTEIFHPLEMDRQKVSCIVSTTLPENGHNNMMQKIWNIIKKYSKM